MFKLREHGLPWTHLINVEIFMLFNTTEDKDVGISWQKSLKIPPANANTKIEKSYCAQDIWGRESTKGEAPALLKSVGNSSLTSAKPVLYLLRLSHGPDS